MAKMDYETPEREGLGTVEETEASLRAEIEDLKRQLAERQHPAPATAAPPTRRALWLMALFLAVLIVIGFVTGYVPYRRREAVLAGEAVGASQALPTVTVVSVVPSADS